MKLGVKLGVKLGKIRGKIRDKIRGKITTPPIGKGFDFCKSKKKVIIVFKQTKKGEGNQHQF